MTFIDLLNLSYRHHELEGERPLVSLPALYNILVVFDEVQL